MQYRNTTKNPQKDMWYGVGSLWLIFSHDVILDKSNVLYRTMHYDLTLNGVAAFENKQVYEISFTCKRPGAYTTGFGYPAPRSAMGKIFIDVESYAVLRFEVQIIRKPVTKKKWHGQVLDPYGTQLIQTYKEVEGKYFLNYSRQLHFGRYNYPQVAKSYDFLDMRELVSTEVMKSPVRNLTTSVMQIKTKSVVEDAAFWQSHNYQVEDNVREAYKLMKRE